MTTLDTLDATDRQILQEMQNRVPMTHRPFQDIGQKLGLGEQKCLERIVRLRQSGAFAGITTLFDPQALGYERTLLALKLTAASLQSAMRELSAYPGTTHAAERRDPFCVWCTAWVPAEHTIPQLAKALHRRTQADETLVLSALRVYKGSAPGAEGLHPWLEAMHEQGGGRRLNAGSEFNETDRRCIRVMQQELPLLEMPFGVWAEEAEMREEAFFDWGRRMEQQGVLTRLAAIPPRTGDGGAEILVVWEVPEGVIDDVGSKIARLREATHVVRRPVFPGWPYALFAVFHAESEAAYPAILKRVESVAGSFPAVLLPLVRETARRSLQLCRPEMEIWWSRVRETQQI